MSLPQPLLRSVRLARHFAITRALEVLVLQASPILGCVLGGYRVQGDGLVPLGLLLFGSCALTAHVFIFNDWAGHESDLNDPRRAASLFSRHGVAKGEVGVAAIALLALANIVFALIGLRTWLLGAAIAACGIVYSASPMFGKSTPVAASIHHLIGGTLHFLLGYTLVHALDANGIWVGVFFGLVFAAGHLNQEVRDYDADRLNGIRTNAVVFGRRRAFLASVFVFTSAYAMLVGLAACGVLPRLLLLSPIAWFLQLAWSLRALRHGLDFDTAVWMQRRYRWLFALVGIAMLTG